MSETTKIDTFKNLKSHPFEILSILALFVSGFLFIASVLKIFGIIYGIDFGEGYLANMSLDLVLGNNPYHPLDQPPWIVSSYPPLYPFLNGLLLTIFGPSLIPGRFIATAAFIGIFVTAIVLLRRFGVGTSVALLSAGMLLMFPWGPRWAQVVRVDTLGILLTIIGLYFFARSVRISDGVTAAIFLSLSVLTKQSLLAAPLACLIYAFISRDMRRFIFLALMVILTGGSYAILDLMTGGGLLLHLFSYTANAWFPERFVAGLGDYIRATWILQIVALSAMLMPGVSSGRKGVLGWYYILANSTLVAYGFEGSDTNYYIEPLLSASLLAGLAFQTLTQIRPSGESNFPAIPNARTLGFALILLIFILGRFIDQSGYQLHRVDTREKLENGQWLLRMCHDVPGDVLSEDASYTFLAGKPVLFQPYIMSLLARTGKWDQSEFVQTIRDGKYSIIILRVDLTDPYNTESRGGAWEMAGFDRWTDEMEDAITERYALHGAVDVGAPANFWFVYFPKTEEEIPRAAELPVESEEILKDHLSSQSRI